MDIPGCVGLSRAGFPSLACSPWTSVPVGSLFTWGVVGTVVKGLACTLKMPTWLHLWPLLADSSIASLNMACENDSGHR